MQPFFLKLHACLLTSCVLWLCSAAVAAEAGDWPQKPVRLIVPYAPGGSTDLLGRTMAEHLRKSLKQVFIVENRSGAGGTIGSQVVAKSAADGYTLVVSGIGSHVIAPASIAAGFNPLKDFTHIASLGGPPTALLVNANLPVHDLRGLLAYVPTQEKGLSWGSPGSGTHAHLIGELFIASNKLNMVHISYKGGSMAMVDLVGGQIQAGFTTLTSASPHIRSGKVRVLAVTSAKRLKDYPDVPTFAELGYPQLTATTWFAISGPAGLPPAITEKLNAEIRRGLQTIDVQKVYALQTIEAQDLDSDKFNAFFKAEIDKWTPIIHSLGPAK